MRTRTRTQVITCITRVTEENSKGVITAQQVLPRSANLQISQITDDNSKYRGDKPCTHHHLEIDDQPWILPRAWSPTTQRYRTDVIGGIYAHYGPLQQPDGFAIPDMLINAQPDYEGAMNELLRDAQGAMPTNVNMVVNALEFASVKTLVPQIIKIGKNIVKSGFAKQSLKELANGHLLHSFGIKPLITDIKGFLDIRSAIEDRIQALERRNLHKVKLVKRTSKKEILGPYAGTFSSTPLHRGEYSGKVAGTVEGTVSADCIAFYNTASPGSQCKLWASALGFSTPLLSAWEIVPFSFVFDWFVPVGSNLQKLEDRLGLHETAMYYTLRNFMHSKTVRTTASATGSTISTYYPSWTGRKFVCPVFRAKMYSRQPGIPAAGSLIPPIGWSLGKTALSISLIAQKAL